MVAERIGASGRGSLRLLRYGVVSSSGPLNSLPEVAADAIAAHQQPVDKAGRAPRPARRPADKARIGRHTGRIPTDSQRRAKRSAGMSSPVECRPALSTGCWPAVETAPLFGGARGGARRLHPRQSRRGAQRRGPRPPGNGGLAERDRVRGRGRGAARGRQRGGRRGGHRLRAGGDPSDRREHRRRRLPRLAAEPGGTAGLRLPRKGARRRHSGHVARGRRIQLRAAPSQPPRGRGAGNGRRAPARLGTAGKPAVGASRAPGGGPRPRRLRRLARTRRLARPGA